MLFRTTYRTAMTLETVLLASLISTLTFTSSLGKAAFAVWIWAIYFTFPGTYSTQPAVTTQTFGHRQVHSHVQHAHVPHVLIQW